MGIINIKEISKTTFKAHKERSEMVLLTHSLTHLLTHSLTYLLTHLLTYSLTHSLFLLRINKYGYKSKAVLRLG